MDVLVWVIVAVVGLLMTLIQLMMPDLVPPIIDDLIIGASRYTSVVLLLKAFLYFWLFGGYLMFIGGIVALATTSMMPVLIFIS